MNFTAPFFFIRKRSFNYEKSNVTHWYLFIKMIEQNLGGIPPNIKIAYLPCKLGKFMGYMVFFKKNKHWTFLWELESQRLCCYNKHKSRYALLMLEQPRDYHFPLWYFGCQTCNPRKIARVQLLVSHCKATLVLLPPCKLSLDHPTTQPIPARSCSGKIAPSTFNFRLSASRGIQLCLPKLGLWALSYASLYSICSERA